MDDFKQVFKDNYLRYASYVILDRAIPHLADGLKPVQRRILYTLFLMDNGKLHKVANVAGQTMALHPHGDGPINEALVHLANKGYLLDTQGNFGNPLTGDPPAAPRYIETRLSALAKETLFNPQLTQFTASYDGRAQEPLVLPAKIPLTLMQGLDGIAVGMATRIFPHNFVELLKAEIAILENKPFEVLPDFPSGGIMDASDYAQGRGKVKLRAQIEIVDEKTLKIREICYGTTTESLIQSIDEAAKKGQIKIESINDYTAEEIEIEIKLPRGQYAGATIDALYAFTDCQTTIHSNIVVIRDQLPWEATVDAILKFHVEQLVGYLRRELEIERDELLAAIFQKTLEQIFIEHRLYKPLENAATYEKILSILEKGIEPFLMQLGRIPTQEEQERLLAIPIRRISRFDIEKNQEQIKTLRVRLQEIEKELSNVKRYTIKYIQALLKKYGGNFNRRTRLETIAQLDIKTLSQRRVKVGYDPKSGYMGTKITHENAIECSNLDKLLMLYEDGTYAVISIPEKQYVHTRDVPLLWWGIADKTTPFSALYFDGTLGGSYAKRFIIKQFILEKTYNFVEPESKLLYLSLEPHLSIELISAPQKRRKLRTIVNMDEILIKNVTAKGKRVAAFEPAEIKGVK